MKAKMIVAASVLLILLFSLSAVSASNHTSFSQIQDEIDSANDGETITISGHIKDSDNIIVNKSITIIGDNLTLDGSNCIFSIQARNVTVKGVSFINGWCVEISNSSTLLSCSFKNNSPADNSAINALFENGTEINIIGCSFDANSIKNAKRADLGGAITATSYDNTANKLNIINSTFSNNFGCNGGAIQLLTDTSTLSTCIANCTFTRNTAAKGAIYVNNTYPRNSLKISDSRFVANKVLTLKSYRKYFKGIYEDDEGFDEEGDFYLMVKPAYDISIEGQRYINDAKRGPVLVGITDFSLDIDGCLFETRKSEYNYNEYSLIRSCSLNNNRVSIRSSTFTYSTIFYSDYQCRMNIENCSFHWSELSYISYDISEYVDPFDFEEDIENPGNIELKTRIDSSSFVGGGQNFENGYVTDSTFCNVTIESHDYSSYLNDTFTNSRIELWGNLSIDRCTFSDSMQMDGSCIHLEESYSLHTGRINEKPITLYVRNSIFKNNCARYEGGAIYCSSGSLEFYVENSTFINNTAQNGGAIYAFAKKGHIINCIFENNRAKNTASIFRNYNRDYYGEMPLDEYMEGDGFTSDTLYDKDTNVIGIMHYANSVFGNVSIECNFWGVNIECQNEFLAQNIISASPPESWINIETGNSSIRFALNNGSEVKNMPDYAIILKDSSGNVKTVIIKNGTGDTESMTDPDAYTTSNLPINKLPARIKITQSSSSYYSKKVIKIVLRDINNNALANKVVYLKFASNKVIYLKTDSRGSATYVVRMSPKIYSITASLDSRTYKMNLTTLKNVRIVKLPILISVKKMVTTYDSQKTMRIKVIDKLSGKAVKGLKLNVKAFTGKKSKTYHVKTNSKGIAEFKCSSLNVGQHKVEIITSNRNYDLKKTSTSVKINKAPTIVKAPKITSRFGHSKYFKVSVKNKATKKPVKNTYIHIKIGKKTFRVKTNSKGIAKINTKGLKVGKHMVTITSSSMKYIMSAKSVITIRK